MVASLLVGLLQVTATEAQRIVDGAAGAAERAGLKAWMAPWSARPTGDRTGQFARATAAWHLYQLRAADSLFGLVAGTSASDALSRRAQLGLSRTMIARGDLVEAERVLATAQEEGRRAGDTLVVLDALVLRAGIIRRVRSGGSAEVLLDSAGSLGAHRVPRIAAVVHCRRAGIVAVRGDLAAMRRLSNLGLEAARAADSKRLEGACHFVRATSFARAGLTDSLRVAMNTTMGLQRSSGDLAALAAALQWYGFYGIGLGQHQRSSEFLREAWSAALASGSVDAQAWTALSRAALASALGDSKSERRWSEVADSFMTRLNDREGKRAVMRMQYTRAFAAGDTARGWRLLDTYLKDTREARDAYNETSALFSHVRHSVNARDAARATQALTALREHLQKTRAAAFQASYRVQDGEVALLSGKPNEAELAFDQALRDIHVTQDAFLHYVYVLRALAIARQGRTADAAREAQSAEESFERWRASIRDSTLRLFASARERDVPSYFTELVARLAMDGRTEDAVRFAESQRARLLREQMADAAAWVGQESRPIGGQAFSLDGFQRTIPNDRVAVVAYLAGRRGVASGAFVITNQNVRFVSLPSVESIIGPTQRLLAAVDGGRGTEVAARELGSALLDPVLTGLDSRIEHLVIVPDEVLHLIPYELLRTSDGKELIDRFEVSYMPSLAIAGDRWSDNRLARGAFVAVGDPAGVSREWSALPGARREVATVARRAEGVVVKTGIAASEQFLKAAKGLRILHVAAHGSVEAWDGRQAALVLAPGGGDDGMLRAGEIAELNLSGALVVLSACQTNTGELLGGEGVSGLTRAFLQAGARTVVATGWRIPDRGVVQMVDKFYKGLAAGYSVSRALREAQLDARRRGEPPATWAAFRVVGDGSRGVAIR